ncbi:MAG: MFS transporter [Dehalococcoidia bacterium]
MRDAAVKEPSPDEASSYRWVVVITWMATHMWGFISIESLGIFLPSMRAELGLSPIQEGWLGASTRIGMLFLAIPSGWLLSRFRPKPLTSVTLVAGALFVLFQAWAPIFALLLLGRFLYGLTVVAREPARTLLIKQWMRPREIVLANATIELLFGIGAGLYIVIPIVLELLDNSWRNTFYLFGTVSLTLTILWHLLGKERITPAYVSEMRSQERSPIGSILRYKDLWLVGIGVVGVEIGFSALGTFWPSYLLDTYGISLTSAAVLFSISGLVAAPGALGMSYLVTRTGKRKLILWVSGILIAFSSAGLLYTGSYPLLILIAVANGFSFTFFPIVMSVPFELSGIKPREVAVAIGFLRSAMMTGAVIGPVLAGFLQDASGDLRLALTVTCLSALTLTVSALLLPGRWNRLAAEQRVLERSSV